MQIYNLIRNEDVTGVSSTGLVAQVVQFDNGKVAVAWCAPGRPQSLAIHNSLEEVHQVHLHDGKSTLEPVGSPLAADMLKQDLTAILADAGIDILAGTATEITELVSGIVQVNRNLVGANKELREQFKSWQAIADSRLGLLKAMEKEAVEVRRLAGRLHFEDSPYTTLLAAVRYWAETSRNQASIISSFGEDSPQAGVAWAPVMDAGQNLLKVYDLLTRKGNSDGPND